MNVGIKEYCKFLENEIGSVGNSKINLNKNYNNLHFSIPIYDTDLENDGLNLSLNFSLSSIDNISHFGKGFKLNYNQGYYTDSYGAPQNLQEGIINKETGQKLLPYLGSDGCFKVEDLNGRIYTYEWYEPCMGLEYPDTITIPGQRYISITKDSNYLYINRIEKAKLQIVNNKITNIEILENEILKSRVIIDYNSENYLTYIKYYNHSNVLVKQVNLIYDYDNNLQKKYIKIADVMNKVSYKYNYSTTNNINLLETFINNIQISKYDINYFNNYTEITDIRGRKTYTYFYNDLPIYDIDYRGRIQNYKFNENKKLIKKSDLHYNSYEAASFDNVVNNGYFRNGTNSWKIDGSTGYSAQLFMNPSNEPFKTALGDYCLKINNQIQSYNSFMSQTINIVGKKDDELTLFLWAKNFSQNSKSPTVRICLYKGSNPSPFNNTQITLNNYSFNSDIWECHTMDVVAEDDYDRIYIVVTTPPESIYLYAGIQIYKKSFNTYYNYTDNGLISNLEKGKVTKTLDYDRLNRIKEIHINNLYDKKQVYSESGLLMQERSSSGAKVRYKYDDPKNRLTETIKKYDKKYIQRSTKYDSITGELGILKNEYTTETDGFIQNIFESKSKNVIQSIDENGVITYYNYNDLDNIKYMYMDQRNEHYSVTYDYEENRIIKKYTSQNGINYTYTYDDIDRVLSIDTIYAYDGDGPSSGEIFNNVILDYFNYTNDQVKSKKYGGFGDKFIFEYDEYDRIKKIKHQPKNSSIEKLKCEYSYDALDRIKKFDEYIYYQDQMNEIVKTLSKEYEYDVRNQVLNIIEKRDNILLYKKKFEYDNNGNVINILYENIENKGIIQQYDRIDELSNNSSQVFSSDFKYKDKDLKILSCFFNEESYDEKLKEVIYSKDLSANIIDVDGKIYKRIISPDYGSNDIVIEDKTFNSLNLDNSAEYLSYKFFSTQPRTYDIFKTVLFWFYVGDISSNYGKYILSIGDDESKNYLGVYIADLGRLCLKVVDDKSVQESKYTNGYIKPGWNFFALDYWVNDELGQGFPRASQYKLYLNDYATINISGKGSTERFINLTSNPLINIGCQRFKDNNKINNFIGRITSLIITYDSNISSIEEYKNILNRNIINARGNVLLDDNLQTVSAESTTIINEESKFGLNYINLNNTLNSLSGLKPYYFLPKSINESLVFKINPITKRDAFNAHGSILSYKFGVSESGTIAFRCYIDKTVENSNQFLVDNYDGRTESLSLYRSSNGNIMLQIRTDNVINTGLTIADNTWKFISISWYITNSTLYESGYKLFYTVKCGDKSFSDYKEISFKYSEMTTYIGLSKDGEYPLFGQVEMLYYNKNHNILECNNNYLQNVDIISSTNEFDNFELLKKSSLTKYGNIIYSNEYKYKEIDKPLSTKKILPNVTDLKINFKDNQKTFTYGYEANGNINRIDINNILRSDYLYDDLNRLISEYNNNYSNSLSADYQYDSNGNILWKYLRYPDFDYNYAFKYDEFVKDRLMSIEKNGIIKNLEYNDAFFGNPTFYGTGIGENKDGIFYTWEGRRLTNYYDNIEKLNIEYKYNSENIRIEKIINGKQIKYIYDGDTLLSEINTTNGIKKYFRYDENNKLISIKYNGNSYYYIRELSGNIIGLVDDSGVFVVKYEYDSFGNIVAITDTSNTNLGKENPFIYKDYYYDFESSMYYCKTRYYIPEWCRWLNADDVSYLDPSSINGLNLFAYCNNNPIMMVDHDGNAPKWLRNILIGVGVIVAAAVVGSLIVASCGSATPLLSLIGTSLVTGFKIAAVAGVTSGVIRTGRSLVKNIGEENSFGDTMVNAGKSFLEGFGDGFLAGAEYFAATTALSVVGNVSSGLFNNGYGYNASNFMMGYQNPKVSGITLFASKIGGKLRIDMDPTNSLHYHYGKSKSTRDVHRGAWIGGIIVGIYAGFSGEVY